MRNFELLVKFANGVTEGESDDLHVRKNFGTVYLIYSRTQRIICHYAGDIFYFNDEVDNPEAIRWRDVLRGIVFRHEWDSHTVFTKEGKGFTVEVVQAKCFRLYVQIGHTHPKAGSKLTALNSYGNGITYYNVTSDGCVTGTDYSEKNVTLDEVLADGYALFVELSDL